MSLRGAIHKVFQICLRGTWREFGLTCCVVWLPGTFLGLFFALVKFSEALTSPKESMSFDVRSSHK